TPSTTTTTTTNTNTNTTTTECWQTLLADSAGRQCWQTVLADRHAGPRSCFKNRLKWAKKQRQRQLSQTEAKGPLCGQTVRIIGWDVGPTLVNLTVKVSGHFQAEKRVQIELPGSKGLMTLPESQVCPVTGKEKPPLPDRLDLRTLTAEEKSQALAVAGNQVEFLQPASMLAAPE
ncbi:MAG: hypothetical protein GY772_31830, partial [bacterium]|nr:hypothetical protein [bacterium]